MRTLSIPVVLASSLFVVAACTPKAQTQPDPNANGGYPGAYPPPGQAAPGQAQYPQQPYPAPAPAPAPAPVAPGAPAPASSGPMAVPGPLAFSCQNDVPCGTHHCNMQYGKCAFPCQTANDCITPNQCMAGLCVPLPPQPH
jgi:hypothetical protein